MTLGKQAKVLSDNQQKAVMAFISTNRLAQRNTVMFLLSVDAGLRAKEVASLEWSMITNADGSLADVIRLQDRAAKGSSGGIVYMLGFDGCSSHSGRRTAITRWARKISSVGGSLRDVQALARHSSLQMTQRCIEVSEDACRLVVG